MTKFIRDENGSYVNINQITCFEIHEHANRTCCVKICIISHAEADDRIWELMYGFSDKQSAKEWLDEFMINHGLCCDVLPRKV